MLAAWPTIGVVSLYPLDILRKQYTPNPNYLHEMAKLREFGHYCMIKICSPQKSLHRFTYRGIFLGNFFHPHRQHISLYTFVSLAFSDVVLFRPLCFGSFVRSAACDVICRHALSAVLNPPSGGGRAAATVTSSLLLWILEGDQESCSEVLAERWQALRLRVAALADEVRFDTTQGNDEATD